MALQSETYDTASTHILESLGVNQQVVVDNTDAWLTIEQADDIAQMAGYIETLERAVLASWEQVVPSREGYNDTECAHCEGAALEGIQPIVHGQQCIVPSLLSKYGDD